VKDLGGSGFRQQFQLELTREEMERIFILSYRNEAGSVFPLQQDRLCRLIDGIDPSIRASATERFGR
jgi:hypothetical protein